MAATVNIARTVDEIMGEIKAQVALFCCTDALCNGTVTSGADREACRSKSNASASFGGAGERLIEATQDYHFSIKYLLGHPNWVYIYERIRQDQRVDPALAETFSLLLSSDFDPRSTLEEPRA